MLQLGGCDVVLRVNWLETLDPITWDFSKLSIIFEYEKQKVELKGLQLKHLIGSCKALVASISQCNGFILQIEEEESM